MDNLSQFNEAFFEEAQEHLETWKPCCWITTWTILI